jgi:hypothetical protein
MKNKEINKYIIWKDNEKILHSYNELKDSFYELKTITDNKLHDKEIKENFNDVMIQENFYEDDGIKKIGLFIKNVEKFFKRLGQFLKKVKKIFTFTREKAIAIGATIFIPFIGQLYARYVLLNGSLHLPYLFLISFPPFSIIVALLILFGFVEEGKGGKPYDHYVYIPIIAYTLSNLLFILFENEKLIITLQIVILQISLFIMFFLRSKKICNKYATFSTLIIQTLIGYILITLLPIVLEYLPLLGSGYKIFLKVMPLSRVLSKIVIIGFVYIIMNMISGTIDKEFCKNNNIEKKYILILFIISIIFTMTVNSNN